MTHPERPSGNALTQEINTAIIRKFADLHEQGLLLKSWAGAGVLIFAAMMIDTHLLSLPSDLIVLSLLAWMGSWLHVKSAVNVARYRDNGFEAFDNEGPATEANEEEEADSVAELKRDYERGELTEEEFEDGLEDELETVVEATAE
jgi:hypothetical protein